MGKGERRGQSSPGKRKHIDIRQLLQVQNEGASPTSHRERWFIAGKGAGISDGTISWELSQTTKVRKGGGL
jgi:hypothetical protein